LDPDAALNLVLVLCALLFVIALVYRAIRARTGPEGEREANGQPSGPMEGTLHATPGGAAPEEAQLGHLFARISTENPAEVRKSAGRMLDYAVLRGGATHVRPEVLERIALQFGLLEVVLREESRSEDGLCVISEENMSKILRESFRRAASQARN
jgi:hypothetical protein